MVPRRRSPAGEVGASRARGVGVGERRGDVVINLEGAFACHVDPRRALRQHLHLAASQVAAADGAGLGYRPLLVARTFTDVFGSDEHGRLRAAAREQLDDLMSSIPAHALLRFSTPWQAGGLAPSELPAHRIYLRQLAHDVCAALADMVRDASLCSETPPSELELEISAHWQHLTDVATRSSEQLLDGHADARTQEPALPERIATDFLLAVLRRAGAASANSSVIHRKIVNR